MTNGQRTVTILLAIVAVTSTANAAIIFVDDDNCPGPGDGSQLDPFCSIQTAIDKAVEGDEIVVAPGTYFENIDFLGKAITLRSSDGPQVTIIEGDSLDTVVCFDDVEVRETVMDGFKITNGIGHLVDLQRFGGGVFIDGISSPTIKNCVVAGNTSARGGGISSGDLAAPLIDSCSITGNRTFGSNRLGGGIYVLGAGAVVLNCVISGNFDVDRGGGVWGKDASLIGCSIRFNDADQSSAIHGSSGSPMYIADTTICTNWGSTFQIGVAFIDGGGNTIVDECPAECPVQECQADLSGNGSVDVPDLLKLLANWGACPVP